MTSGWNLWVWLECIGVVSGCCCKKVYRYLYNNWGEPERAPHLSYCCAKSSLYIRAVRLSAVQFGLAKGRFKRATRKVGPASKGSKVNNIALKMATFVLRFN